MQPSISVVIPTLNAGQSLARTIAAVRNGAGSVTIQQIVVSDGGSSDDTCQVAQELGAEIVQGPAGRGGQLARGAQAASGGWLLFLHADTVLSPDWGADAACHLAQSDRAAVFRLRFDDDSAPATRVAAWANLRTRYLGLPYGDQGLLISVTHYQAAGGFADIPLMEDVDMARKLRGQITLLNASATTSAARYQAEGWVRRGARNMMLLARYFAGSDPKVLARHYRVAGNQASRN